jgi:2-polyprenyl-6-methoxyphenol hydroxylase-like FAD-dependent oxidoreductase
MKTDGSRRVAIVGASFAGLFAAAAMASAGAEVTVLERDRLQDRAEPRSGVPQGAQPHILLYRGLLGVEALLPGLERDVAEAGGLRLDTAKMPWLGRYGWAPNHLPSFDILSVSRPVLELLVRRRVLQIPRVRIRDGFRVSGLAHTTEGWQIRGSTGDSVFADLVVDASGRGSRLPQWLGELGYTVPEPHIVEAKLGYASRRYQGPPSPPLESGLVIIPTPESPVGSTILPIEDRQWLVLAAGYGDRRPSRDPDEFTDFLTALRDRAATDLLSRLQPLGEIAVYRQTGNRRVPYAQAKRWPPRLLVTGDALCAFNPIYGQGITVAAMQAELLRAAVTDVRDIRSTRRLQRRLFAVTDLPWAVATSEDVRQPSSTGRQKTRQRIMAVWTDRMNRLVVAGDPACAEALVEVYHLVGAPRLLFSHRVVASVLRSYVRGVPPPLPRPAVLDRLVSAEEGEEGRTADRRV